LQIYQQPAEIEQAPSRLEVDEEIHVAHVIALARATAPKTLTFLAPYCAARRMICSRLLFRSSSSVILNPFCTQSALAFSLATVLPAVAVPFWLRLDPPLCYLPWSARASVCAKRLAAARVPQQCS